MNVLSVCQVRIHQILWFMYKVKDNLHFANTFKEIHHKYPTRYSKTNFEKSKTIKSTSFVIFSCGPHIWSNFLEISEKAVLSLLLFLTKLKSKPLESQSELCFFQHSVWICKMQHNRIFCSSVFFLFPFLQFFAFQFSNVLSILMFFALFCILFYFCIYFVLVLGDKIIWTFFKFPANIYSRLENFYVHHSCNWQNRNSK